MSSRNTLLLNPANLHQLNFQLKTKARSLGFGRRLYYLEVNPETGSALWLKTQTLDFPDVSQHAQTGLRCELDFYEACGEQEGRTFMLPHQIIRKPFQIGNKSFNQALILTDAPAHFDVCPKLFPIQEIRQHMLRALKPLISLQELGYLHADLKREHFVIYQNRVCLIDFEQVQPLNTTSQAMNATPRYMAPELFQGQAKSLQSEVYALGIIFYEWLTGQRLEATDYQDWALLHCQHFKPELPAQYQALQSLLQNMLRKHSQDRLSDFKAVKQALLTEIA
ncbi:MULTISPECIES: protein kinase domain-containing protein [unclassified Acinetobacter]|uniref:protein kinase domain-containing protein n=1 Tax=unclassified Acinetobacter TaxID=196816 RepID=UPI0015D32FF3|nr:MULTISPECIES: protein kinase [unclassified Acinetobacter]